jgi:putative FmdB family regulatory protein
VAIYPFKCPKCGRAWEVIQSPLETLSAPKCECGSDTKRIWTQIKVYRSSSFTAGYDVGLGRYFDTDRERTRYLDHHRPGKIEKVYKRPKGIKV